MEDNKEKNGPWLSVPQFGDWDQKGQVPDYSLDFSKIRENRKQNKREVSRASLGNEEELVPSTTQTKNSSPTQSDQLQSNQIHNAPPGTLTLFTVVLRKERTSSAASTVA